MRILVRADAATLARMYAVAKAEEAAMDAHLTASLNDMFRQHARKQRERDGSKDGDSPAGEPDKSS